MNILYFIFCFFVSNIIYGAVDGYYVEMKLSTFSQKNTQTNEVIIKQWYTPQNILLIQGKDQYILIKTGLNKAYIINHDKKEFMPMPLNQLQLFISASSAQKDFIKDLKIQKTDTLKIINTWPCSKISVEASNYHGIVWITEEFNLDQQLITNMSNNFPVLGFVTSVLSDSLEIKGFPVEVTSKMKIMGTEIKTLMELLSFEKRDVDPNLLELPVNYRELTNPYEK